MGLHTRGCQECSPGKFVGRNSSTLNCTQCDIGRCNPHFRQASCELCPRHKTTQFKASTQVSECYCMPGFAVPIQQRRARLNDKTNCTECPIGAYCKGNL